MKATHQILCLILVTQQIIATAQAEEATAQTEEIKASTNLAEMPKTQFELPEIMKLTGVELSGNTAFSTAQLLALVTEFIGKELEQSDVEELRYRITRFYIENGYINSGAVILGYDATQQHLRLQILEGSIKEIKVNTTPGLNPNYVAERLKLSSGAPFHLPSLQERFLLLLDDPLIESLHGEISPGLNLGEGVLNAEATERRRYNLGLTVNNHSPVTLGEWQGLLHGNLRNIVGWGEIFSFGYDLSDGNQRRRVNLAIPINAQDTKIYTNIERGKAAVIEEPADLLDITSKYRSYELGIVHPLIKTLKKELTIGLNFGAKNNRTKLLGRPFSMSQGSIDGKVRVAPLKVTQNWVSRDVDRMYAINSSINWGTPALGATDIEIGAINTKYVTWLLQQRYIKSWLNNQLQLHARWDMQFADSALPALEQLGIGGVDTVRGYRENTLIRDQALLGSLELRYRLWDQATQERYGRLEGAIFTDFAHGWNKTHAVNEKNETNELASLGLGLLWSWKDIMRFELYWGHQLKSLSQKTQGSVQDRGIHLQLQVNY